MYYHWTYWYWIVLVQEVLIQIIFKSGSGVGWGSEIGSRVGSVSRVGTGLGVGAEQGIGSMVWDGISIGLY